MLTMPNEMLTDKESPKTLLFLGLFQIL